MNKLLDFYWKLKLQICLINRLVLCFHLYSSSVISNVIVFMFICAEIKWNWNDQILLFFWLYCKQQDIRLEFLISILWEANNGPPLLICIIFLNKLIYTNGLTVNLHKDLLTFQGFFYLCLDLFIFGWHEHAQSVWMLLPLEARRKWRSRNCSYRWLWDTVGAGKWT